MAEKFENILEKCLERVTVKGDSIEACLNDYPEHASRLEPLLRVAISTSSSAHSIQVDPQAKLKVKNKMMDEFHRSQQKHGKAGRAFVWKYRWALPAMLLLLILIGSGLVIAADDSMPNEALYPVKTTMEKIRLSLTSSDLDKAKLHITYAERRAKEMAVMAEQNKAGEVEKLMRRINSELNKVMVLSENIKNQKNGASKVEKVISKLQRSGVLTSIDSLPDEPLYQVKMAVEETLVNLTISELGKARLHMIYAEQTFQKIAELGDYNNNSVEIDELLRNAEQHLANIDALVESWKSRGIEQGEIEEMMALLERGVDKNLNVFNKALEQASSQEKPRLEQIFRRISQRLDKELAFLDKIKHEMGPKFNPVSP